MSQQPIARSADLGRLRDDGYSIRIVGGHLVVDDVPFVDDKGAVHHDGMLIMPLTVAGTVTAQPSDHTARFSGGIPSHQDGRPLSHIINHTRAEGLGDGLTSSCYLSAKPTGSGRYDDHHHKVTTYVGHIVGPARAIDPDATAWRYRPARTDDADGPFRFLDTASSRAGIGTLNELLGDERVGIVGLGGSGQYILDGVSKTPAREIHLFDGDDFLTHNAFRGPGAPTLEQLDARPFKVDYFGDIYDRIHCGIHRHRYPITEGNVGELSDLSFVFVAVDDAEAKGPIIRFLVEADIPFVDVGMGIELIDGRLTGSLRTTLVTPTRHDHASQRIPTVGVGDDDDAYRTNIQIAELNMLNAAQALLIWKKYRNFYADWDEPHHVMYSIASNRIANDEYPDALEGGTDDVEAA